jgi:NADH-quinone oxidoreductase subunit G
VNSLLEIKPIMEELKATSTCKYQFIEVMNCPMGCIGGPGQATTDKELLMKRREALFSYDKQHKYRAAHLNEYVLKLYDGYFGGIGSPKAHEIMHTRYEDRSQEDAGNFTCKITDKDK